MEFSFQLDPYVVLILIKKKKDKMTRIILFPHRLIISGLKNKYLNQRTTEKFGRRTSFAHYRDFFYRSV